MKSDRKRISRPTPDFGFRNRHAGGVLIGVILWTSSSAISGPGTERSARDVSAARIHSRPLPLGKPAADAYYLPSPPLIWFPPTPMSFPAGQALRQIELVNGDRLTVEIVAGSANWIEVRWYGEMRFRIPLPMIARISSLPGERDVFHERFSDHGLRQAPFAGDVLQAEPPRIEQGVLNISASRRPFRVELPHVSGDFRCSFRVLIRAEKVSAPHSIQWTAHFSPDKRLQVQLDRNTLWRVQSSESEFSFRQPAPAKPGWHVFRLQRTGQRLFVSLDNFLLSAGTSPTGELSAWEAQVTSDDPQSSTSLIIDHFSVTALGQPQIDFPLRPEIADAIVGANGESWWGRLQDLGPDQIAWRDAETTWQRPWRDVGGIQFHAAVEAVAGRELTGKIVSLRLQPSTDRPDLPGDQLTVALGASRNGWMEVEHPLMGRLVIPAGAAQRVERRLTGIWKLLDARELELGNRISAGDVPPVAGEFVCKESLSSRVYFSLEASGLEPSGPATPPGSPTLKALRAGRLVTELFINETRVGNFNELTSDWSLPGKFDRLRLLVPGQILKPGRNTWRIAQQPGDGPRTNFDECRIRNLGWETELSLK